MVRADGVSDSPAKIMSKQEIVIGDNEIRTLNNLIEIYSQELRQVRVSLMRLNTLQGEMQQVSKVTM